MSKYYYTYSQDKVDNLFKEQGDGFKQETDNLKAELEVTNNEITNIKKDIQQIDSNPAWGLANYDTVGETAYIYDTGYNSAIGLNSNGIFIYTDELFIDFEYDYHKRQIYIPYIGMNDFSFTDLQKYYEEAIILNPEKTLSGAENHIATSSAIKTYVDSKVSPFTLYKNITSETTIATLSNGTYLVVPSRKNGFQIIGSTTIAGTKQTITMYSPIILSASSTIDISFYTPAGSYYHFYNATINYCKLYNF